MPDRAKIVAVGLLTEQDLAVLGQGFRRAYRLDEQHDFHELLAAIDAAERRLTGAGDRLESADRVLPRRAEARRSSGLDLM